MENKKEISIEKLEAAAKVLGLTVDAIEKFNEKNILNNNIALEQGTGQTNHVYPVKEIIEYFKDELLKKDNKIEELSSELKEYKKSKRKSTKPTEAKLKSVPGKQVAQ